MIYPHHDKFFEDYPVLSNKVEQLVELISVARVRPKTSKGITDLLLPQTSICFNINSPSKKYSRKSSTHRWVRLHRNFTLATDVFF